MSLSCLKKKNFDSTSVASQIKCKHLNPLPDAIQEDPDLLRPPSLP